MARKKRDATNDMDTQQVAPPEPQPNDRAPKPSTRTRKPKVTQAMAAGVIDAVEALSFFVGHRPDPAERDAAVAGLLAASRKSPVVAQLLAGGADVGDYGAIVLGLGGLAARIGLDVAAARSGSEQVADIRQRVYLGTGVAYQLVGGLASSVETGRARGASRSNPVGENIPGEPATSEPEIPDNAGIEDGPDTMGRLAEHQTSVADRPPKGHRVPVDP